MKMRKMTFYLSILCLILCLLFYLGIQMSILSLEDQVLRIRNQREMLEMEVKNLEVRAADLRKGSRIKKIAHERLGMEIPEGAPEKLF